MDLNGRSTKQVYHQDQDYEIQSASSISSTQSTSSIAHLFLKKLLHFYASL